jgi:acetyltransferase-like isoleucine patch superfamily enzyme/glycine cleavage system H lipoate-binding protein
VLEIVLTREDANTEFALLSEWLVGDREQVTSGQPVCVVETTKATVEVEAPGDGTLVQLYDDGVEVELGGTVALIAESPKELETALARREPKPEVEAESKAKDGKATRKAIELAELHGVDLARIDKRGFITEKDVEGLIAHERAAAAPAARGVLEGVSTAGVSLPASFELDEAVGALDPDFLESLRSEPEAFRLLSSEEKCERYRAHGAVIGQGVVLGEGTLVLAPRIVVEDGVEIGPGGTVRCEELAAFGTLTRFGPDLELLCRRAYIGAGVWAGRSIRIGGGGHRDPWAVLAVGDLAFIGDEAFVNVCRPVLIGREAFLTMRSLIVTHNIGHSVLEGFENRFAPVVLEDRSQVGLGAVIYAGCRIGAEAIVASSSYVVGDVPAGAFAIGVPAKATGSARHALSRPRQVELGRRMIDDLHELLSLNGHSVSAIVDGDSPAFDVEAEGGTVNVRFVPVFRGAEDLASENAESVVLTLEARDAEVPARTAVLDLLERRVHGDGGVVLESVREFCRKRGIRFEPGPWRYRGGFL